MFSVVSVCCHAVSIQGAIFLHIHTGTPNPPPQKNKMPKNDPADLLAIQGPNYSLRNVQTCVLYSCTSVSKWVVGFRLASLLLEGMDFCSIHVTL